jgi:hypothetical protein
MAFTVQSEADAIEQCCERGRVLVVREDGIVGYWGKGLRGKQRGRTPSES